MEISLAFIGSAFVAGLLTFLAPCTLPLVPAYLGFISGVDVSDNTEGLSADKHRKIITNAAMFVIGFTTIFILFGMLAGLLGQALAQWRIWLTRISGAFIIIFGFIMVFNITVSAFASSNLKLPDWAHGNNPFNSLLFF
jgi:cytochrome c-type biogenesis protein